MRKVIKIVAATAVGFAAGILMAPASGEHTRKTIKKKAHGIRGLAEEKVEQAKEAIIDTEESIKEGVGIALEEVEGMERSTRRSAKDLGDEAKTRSSRVSAQAKRTANEVKKK